MDIINAIESEYKKEDIVPFKVGDTVDVHIRIKEGNKERIQVFTGTVIKRQNSGLNETFTVRKISYGVGVEKTFPTHSPRIAKIEVKRVGKVRRAKLYYLRDRVGKAAKTKEQVGARIEDREIVVKEDLTEEPAQEDAENVNEAPATETVEEKVEEVKETPAVEEKADESVETPEEAPAIKTENVEVQETVDTVKEEPVEVVKDEAEKADKEEDKKAE